MYTTIKIVFGGYLTYLPHLIVKCNINNILYTFVLIHICFYNMHKMLSILYLKCMYIIGTEILYNNIRLVRIVRKINKHCFNQNNPDDQQV